MNDKNTLKFFDSMIIRSEVSSVTHRTTKRTYLIWLLPAFMAFDYIKEFQRGELNDPIIVSIVLAFCFAIAIGTILLGGSRVVLITKNNEKHQSPAMSLEKARTLIANMHVEKP